MGQLPPGAAHPGSSPLPRTAHPPRTAARAAPAAGHKSRPVSLPARSMAA